MFVKKTLSDQYQPKSSQWIWNPFFYFYNFSQSLHRKDFKWVKANNLKDEVFVGR